MASPDGFATTGGIASRAEGASVIMVEQSKLLPWLMLVSMLSGAALLASFWTISELHKMEVESRLQQQKMMDTEALLLREGLLKPGDSESGPAANLRYKRKE